MCLHVHGICTPTVPMTERFGTAPVFSRGLHPARVRGLRPGHVATELEWVQILQQILPVAVLS